MEGKQRIRSLIIQEGLLGSLRWVLRQMRYTTTSQPVCHSDVENSRSEPARVPKVGQERWDSREFRGLSSQSRGQWGRKTVSGCPSGTPRRTQWGTKLVDPGCVSSQAGLPPPTFRPEPPLPRKAWLWFLSRWVSAVESRGWGSLRRKQGSRRAAARRDRGVAEMLLQALGRQDLGPGGLGSRRPVSRTRGSSRPVWSEFSSTDTPAAASALFRPPCSLQDLKWTRLLFMMFWILLTLSGDGRRSLIWFEPYARSLAGSANITYKDVIGSSCLSSGENLNIKAASV